MARLPDTIWDINAYMHTFLRLVAQLIITVRKHSGLGSMQSILQSQLGDRAEDCAQERPLIKSFGSEGDPWGLTGLINFF
jgi:hypothetical protein